MIDRRRFNIGLTTTAALLATAPAFAQEAEGVVVEDDLPPLPEDLAPFEGQPAVTDYSDSTVVGTGDPLNKEVELAAKLLFASPNATKPGTTPLSVAEFFLAASRGDFGAEYRPFAREWPVRANPVIAHFFTATRTFPEGDTTAWCAAFINWCIARSLATTTEMIGTTPGIYVRKGEPFTAEILARTSRSAASGSFRCFEERDEADGRPGDLIVWQKPGSEGMTKYCGGQGHVAFFLRKEGERYIVLGGNQRDGMSNGAVTRASWPREISTHKWFGIRNVEKKL